MDKMDTAMEKIIEQFCSHYQNFSQADVSKLGGIYSCNATFQDPLHRIEGLANIAAYFSHTMANVNHCKFQIEDTLAANQQAFITWTMTFSHPRLNSGNDIKLAGSSHLKIENDAIYFHRDYFDMGQMIYEQIPLLRAVIKSIKKRMTT